MLYETLPPIFRFSKLDAFFRVRTTCGTDGQTDNTRNATR